MSLMLNALKRIEAKQACVRMAAAQADVASCDSSEPEIIAHASAAVEVAPADPIELPPDLLIDDLSHESQADTALPGPLSIDAALDDLAELIVEARLLDQSPAGAEAAPPDAAGGAAQIADLPLVETVPPPTLNALPAAYTTHDAVAEMLVEAKQLSDAADDLLDAFDASCMTADWFSAPDLDGAATADFSWIPGELSPPAAAESHEPRAAADCLPDAVVESQAADAEIAADATPAEVSDPFVASDEPLPLEAEEIGLPEPAVEFAEPTVVEPVGSDPYAAAAWQIVRQLPQARSQVLLFTSPADGHGKTMTLARLLPHLARNSSGSILVVDANRRNPGMARWLEVAATWRLTDVLVGAIDWRSAVRPTALARVSLLPGGAAAGRRSSVQPTVRLLRELAARYDLVVVDSESLAQAGTAELAAACDATYLVVRLGEGGRRLVREAVQVLDRAGGRLLGCVAVDAGA